MCEFERRKRYITYFDKDCVIYLRKDFNYQCAYCLIKEADLGNPRDFQKDHFVPQNSKICGKIHPKYSDTSFNVHSYYNLYYCCPRCNGNGGKSDTWVPTLLDPCSDKIWDIHIKLDGNLVEPITCRGEEYIKAFHLNSRTAIQIREKIHEQKKRISSHLNELELIKKQNPNNWILKFINEEIENDKAKLLYGIKYIPGDYYFNDREILETERILAKYDFRCLSGDYDLDYEIIFNGVNYKIYLRTQEYIDFINGRKGFYLSVEQVKDWKDENILICQYDFKRKKLFYLKFSEFLAKHPLTTEQKYKYILEENQFL